MIGPGKKGRSKKNGGGPIDPTWLAGLGTPIINGASVQLQDSAQSSVYSDVLTLNTATETDKFYMEFATDPADFDLLTGNQYVGLANAVYKTNGGPLTTGYGFGLSFGPTINYRVTTAMDTTGTVNATNIQPATSPPNVVGIAIDYTANKMWVHVDGTWLTDAGTGGGAPDSGNGWTISGSAIGHLYAATGTGGSAGQYNTFTYQNSGLYVPAGFTVLQP